MGLRRVRQAWPHRPEESFTEIAFRLSPTTGIPHLPCAIIAAELSVSRTAMRIPRVYEPQPLAPGLCIDLGDTTIQHVIRALRLREGDRICLFNGDGHEYPATLTQVDKRSAQATLEPALTPTVESALQIHVGQTLSRGERMDYAVQKATEMGVSRITPLTSERCEVKLKAERRSEERRVGKECRSRWARYD